MFGLGFSEIVLLAVIGLLVLGPEELPKLARNLGRIFNDVKRSADDFKSEIQSHAEPPPNFDYQQHIGLEADQLAKPHDPKLLHPDDQLDLFEQTAEPEVAQAGDQKAEQATKKDEA